MNEGRVGLVTVTYNSAAVLHDFMESTLKQRYINFVLYIIDNSSTDETLEVLKQYSDSRIKLIENKDNLGVAGGNNQGINAAIFDNCEYILLINNDTVFESSLINKLLEGINKLSCDVVIPKMMFYDNPNMIWCAGGYFIPLLAYFTKHYGINEVDRGQYNNFKKINYSPTCCMLMKSYIFKRVGLMDEKYFVYMDDVDYCYRMMKNSVKMYYYPEVTLLHKVSSLTGGSESKFSMRYGTRNRTYFVRKNLNILFQILWIPIKTIKLLLLLLFTKDSAENFSIKQLAFKEGLKMNIVKTYKI